MTRDSRGNLRHGRSLQRGYGDDGESPVHEVSVSTFRISATTVTNEEFAEFADATGHRTESETYGTSAVFHLAVKADPRDILNRVNNVPWWLNVRGADWAHPAGPLSSWTDIPRPSRHACFAQRCLGLLPLGRPSPAHGSRVGIRGPRRAVRAALPPLGQ